MFRREVYEKLFQRALRQGRTRFSSVVTQELYASALSPADKRDYEAINHLSLRQSYILTPSHQDWTTSGILLARYQQRYGALKPRDHINDLLIALSAANAEAELLTENDSDMRRWQPMLRRMGKQLWLTAVRRPHSFLSFHRSRSLRVSAAKKLPQR